MLYLKKIFILILLTVSIIKVTFSAPVNNGFVGIWCWDLDSSVSAFSITIKKISGLYMGSYGSVIRSGNKIDDNDDAFRFKEAKKNVVKAKIKAGISGNTGLIQLKILDNKKIEWFILRKPKGEFYVPQKAILHRCS